MNFSVINGFAAFVLYLAACLILYRQFRGQTVPSRASILIPGTLAVIAHAASLWQASQGFAHSGPRLVVGFVLALFYTVLWD